MMMSQKAMTYEQSLETMNEDGLRAECIRQKKELDRIYVQQLTQPIRERNLDIDDVISMMRQEMEELKGVDCSLNTKMKFFGDILGELILVIDQMNGDVRKLSETIDTDLYPL